MPLRGRLIAILLPLTAASFWIIHELEGDDATRSRAPEAIPAYTMSRFHSLNMNASGKPKTRLKADFMAHFESENETRLTAPELEIYRPGKAPLHIRADRGWVTSGNEVILLQGNVRLQEKNRGGELVLEVATSEARLFPERDYAETDKPATLSTVKSNTESIGMQAYMNDGRIKMLNQVHTTIEQKASN